MSELKRAGRLSVCLSLCFSLSLTLTCHCQGLDACLHQRSLLLLEPRTIEEADGRLEELGHDGVVGLSEQK